MPCEQNVDREKLAETIENAQTPMGGTLLGSREQFEAVADAILNSEWLAEHDERVRREAAAEQREKDAQIAESRAVGWNHDYDNGTFDAAAAIREQGTE